MWILCISFYKIKWFLSLRVVPLLYARCKTTTPTVNSLLSTFPSTRNCQNETFHYFCINKGQSRKEFSRGQSKGSVLEGRQPMLKYSIRQAKQNHRFKNAFLYIACFGLALGEGTDNNGVPLFHCFWLCLFFFFFVRSFGRLVSRLLFVFFLAGQAEAKKRCVVFAPPVVGQRRSTISNIGTTSSLDVY